MVSNMSFLTEKKEHQVTLSFDKMAVRVRILKSSLKVIFKKKSQRILALTKEKSTKEYTIVKVNSFQRLMPPKHKS